MEQITVSPLRPVELIVGKTVPYIFISLALVPLGPAPRLRPLRGHDQGELSLLLLAMTLFLIGGLGQGLLISTITRTQQVAFQLAILTTFLPTFILSGFVFPVRNMPPVVQAVTYLVPARLLPASLLRSIILKGVGLRAFWTRTSFGWPAFAVLMLGVSTLRMTRPGGDGERPQDREEGEADEEDRPHHPQGVPPAQARSEAPARRSSSRLSSSSSSWGTPRTSMSGTSRPSSATSTRRPASREFIAGIHQLRVPSDSRRMSGTPGTWTAYLDDGKASLAIVVAARLRGQARGRGAGRGSSSSWTDRRASRRPSARTTPR